MKYSVKDGVLKVHFRDLPGFHAQKICLIHPDGRAIRCTSFETSAKTKGNVDFYVPQPPGEYHLVVHYHDDKVTDQEERNRQLNLVRDKLIFNAVK